MMDPVNLTNRNHANINVTKLMADYNSLANNRGLNAYKKHNGLNLISSYLTKHNASRLLPIPKANLLGNKPDTQKFMNNLTKIAKKNQRHAMLLEAVNKRILDTNPHTARQRTRR